MKSINPSSFRSIVRYTTLRASKSSIVQHGNLVCRDFQSTSVWVHHIITEYLFVIFGSCRRRLHLLHQSTGSYTYPVYRYTLCVPMHGPVHGCYSYVAIACLWSCVHTYHGTSDWFQPLRPCTAPIYSSKALVPSGRRTVVHSPDGCTAYLRRGHTYTHVRPCTRELARSR